MLVDTQKKIDEVEEKKRDCLCIVKCQKGRELSENMRELSGNMMGREDLIEKKISEQRPEGGKE